MRRKLLSIAVMLILSTTPALAAEPNNPAYT